MKALKRKYFNLSAELIADTLIRIANGEQLDLKEQVKEEGKQYYRMPRKLLLQVDEKLRNISCSE